MEAIILKPANTETEFKQLHRLHYEIFVREIPQHPANENEMLVDKFHQQNNYLLAKRGETIIGSVSFNCNRPFSLDQKLPDLEKYLPASNGLAEIRLLFISKPERKTGIAYKLLKYLCATLHSLKIDAAVISGTTRQLSLYHKMGFTKFGPLVGHDGAWYQPMFITINQLRHDFK